MKLLIISFLSIVYTLTAQTKFDFDFDYAQFGYDSTSNYLEFYYAFNQSSMTVFSEDTINLVEGILHISIEDTTSGKMIVDKDWKVSHQVTANSEKEGQYLIGAIGFRVPYSSYICKIIGRDIKDEKKQRVYTEYITSNRFISDNFVISDIQLASRIIQDSPNTTSVFYKNSMEIFPIPSSVFGESQPVVFYYAELYNLLGKSDSETLKLTSSVYDSKGKEVFSKSKPISRTYNSRVEVGTVVINKYPTDIYTLALVLMDSAASYGVSSSKKFYVFNPSIQITDTTTAQVSGVLASEFGVMSDEELDDLFNKSRYIATSTDVDNYDKLDNVEGKREFLYNFWKARDTDVSTPVNEYYKKYFSRVSFSNQRFGSLSRLGWKSDRGRVFIIYGEPSEIERHPNEVDTKPYEIWYYNELEGGVLFVFGDLTGFSDYILLHSTVRGGLRDENWLRRITTF